MATKAQEPTFDIGAVNEIDQDTIFDIYEGGSGDPFKNRTIQWVNGRPDMGDVAPESLQYNGGFFFPTSTNSKKKFDQLTDEEKAERQAIADVLLGYEKSPWRTTKFTFSDNTVATGVWTRQMGFAICERRQAWSAMNSEKEHRYYVMNDYGGAQAWNADGNPTGKEHIVVQIKGAESVAPIRVTFSGMTMKAFDEVLLKFKTTIIAAANARSVARTDRMRKEYEEAKEGGFPHGEIPEPGPAGKFHPRSFYLAVGSSRNTDGTPKFEKVGGGDKSRLITPPVAIGMPDNFKDVTDQLLGFLQVQPDALKQGSAIVADYQTWAHDWDSFDYSQSPAKPAEEVKETVQEKIDEKGESLLAQLNL